MNERNYIQKDQVMELRVGPWQSPLRSLSLHFLAFYSIFWYFLLFPFLTCFIYFLAFPSLSILSEYSHSVSRLDVVEGK